jgi:hypothetical protein
MGELVYTSGTSSPLCCVEIKDLALRPQKAPTWPMRTQSGSVDSTRRPQSPANDRICYGAGRTVRAQDVVAERVSGLSPLISSMCVSDAFKSSLVTSAEKASSNSLCFSAEVLDVKACAAQSPCCSATAPGAFSLRVQAGMRGCGGPRRAPCRQSTSR